MMLVRVTSAPVNDPHARETAADGFQQKFLQGKTGVLEIQAVKVQMGLNGKTARPQVVQINPAVRLHGSLDVLRRKLYFDISFTNELFERAKGILFLVLWLDFDRGAVVQWDGAPAQ